MPRHARIPAPRSHWLLLGTALVAVVALLSLHALALGSPVDETTPPGDADEVPAGLRAGGPVLDARQDAPVALRPRDKTLALTFDDGPDPVWTPAVLATLDRLGVHATFFVTGARAAQHPRLIREILAHGHEIGGHTATHTDLRAAGALRTQLELRATDLALAGAAGIATSLVRPPHSATPDALDDAAWQAARRLGREGKLVVQSDLDSQDWRRPGVAAIVANSAPPDDRGAILLMHDSGGDRSQTLAALDVLVPRLRAQGWRLDTVSGALGMARAATGAGAGAEAGGAFLVAAVGAGDLLAAVLSVLLVVATALAALRTLLVLATARVHVRRHRFRAPRQADEPVTVIIPARNEEAGIEGTIRSVLASDHPVRVVVVDDGSTDTTAAVVEGLNLARVRLIRQANAGKAAALNTGLAAARTEFVVLVDGGTVLEPSAVRTLVRHFADPAVGAVSGNARAGNRGGLLGRWQHIEYVVGFNLDRRMYDVLECLPTVPGAVGAFRRSALWRLGGVSPGTLAEDTDLTMALERRGWRVVYEPDARALTEAPATLGGLWKQRYRWCYGTLQAVWKHRAAVTEPGAAGRLGRRGLPYLLLFQVVLPVLAPLADVAALFGLCTGDRPHAAGFWCAFLVLQAVPGIVAFRLDAEPLRPLLTLPLQQFVYRQLMYPVVVQSVLTALAGARLPRQKLERRGMAFPPPRRSPHN
ncbi:bifunctional polysaccharide deacetylase/glycosyltransferase family 2 protein [Amycolatopsis anabasis]|uniref:bifunctional polysaccharide deacetylase/glycosyltransferase family 2 protein n=1 Tax=Amycolatopsis anabasis TaxID=1840409 RepID=UPI00131B608C|nr:bifunctional polysaccharide deacetylase/glycosyltransferase family 2 protein [Amycolatopsis anabasis]